MGRSRSAAESPTPGSPSGTSPALAVVGFLMLLTVFLIANPSFGTQREWPWELLVRSDGAVLVTTIFGAWVFTGFWAIVLSLTPARRLRAVSMTALTALLLIACTGRSAGFVIETYNLDQMLAMICIGAGLLIARDPDSRGLGRLLAGVGGVTLAWILAVSFPGEGGMGAARLQIWWMELTQFLGDWNTEYEQPNHLWWSVLPQFLILVAAAGGVLAAIGLVHRTVLLVFFCALFAGLLMPFAVGTALVIPRGSGMVVIVSQLTDTLVAKGFLLWLLAVFVAQDLVRGRGRVA